MNTIKFLAISDTHLGEDASLLNHDLGLELFESNLKEIAGGRQVENVLLLGDITDQVLASQDTYSKSTKKFMGKVVSALDGKIDKVIFLFGNHDLNLFRTKVCGGHPHSKFSLHGLNTADNPCGEALRQLLLPDDIDFQFYIANPLYITQTSDRIFIFHHGHHRPDRAE